MQEKLTLKGKKNGLELHVQDDLDFEELLTLVEKKLKATGDFLKKSPVEMNISLIGKVVLKDEQKEILKALMEKYSLTYVETELIAKPTKITSEKMTINIEENKQKVCESNISFVNGEVAEEQCLIVYKTLRGGQHVSYCGSVVIIGDVNPGATVLAEGNITISGVSRGFLHAGALGDAEAVITASKIIGGQLRIAEYIAVGGQDITNSSKVLERAKVVDGNIVIYNLV